MKPARILVLAIAVVAGLAAAMIASNSKPPEAPPPPPPPAPTDAVLVAAKELHRDDILDENSMRWEPKDNIPEGFIRKSAEPNAIDARKGWTVIENIYKDDYLRPERISKDPRSGLLASLHSGMRAVSINIDAQGSSTAGGFILPNHYVDVIHISRMNTSSACSRTRSIRKGSREILSSAKLLRGMFVCLRSARKIS